MREIQAEKIRELVGNSKYRNTEDFLKTAIDILLTWESARPEECMVLMKDLMPFSAEQEAFMKQSMNSEERKRQFGDMEIDRDADEMVQQKKLAGSDHDHFELRTNINHTRKYVRALKITRPKNVIPYDGYPLLSGFYSRILPVKIVLYVMCDLLEQSKDSKVELNKLRVHAYDIAEEFAEIINRHENEHNILRNKKTSTGLPKKGRDDKDEEKISMAQKRFKDQFIGKVRKNRITKVNHFEGALSALGLVFAFESGGKTFISLTDAGKEFYLLENAIIMGDINARPLSRQEADFVLKKLIPKRKLELRFVEIALRIVRNYQKGITRPVASDKNSKITMILGEEMRQAVIKYVKENPESSKTYNLDSLEPQSAIVDRKIAQWRLATMGRLAELGAVNWSINDKGDSEYSIIHRESR